MKLGLFGGEFDGSSGGAHGGKEGCPFRWKHPRAKLSWGRRKLGEEEEDLKRRLSISSSI